MIAERVSQDQFLKREQGYWTGKLHFSLFSWAQAGWTAIQNRLWPSIYCYYKQIVRFVLVLDCSMGDLVTKTEVPRWSRWTSHGTLVAIPNLRWRTSSGSLAPVVAGRWKRRDVGIYSNSKDISRPLLFKGGEVKLRTVWLSLFITSQCTTVSTTGPRWLRSNPGALCKRTLSPPRVLSLQNRTLSEHGFGFCITEYTYTQGIHGLQLVIIGI